MVKSVYIHIPFCKSKCHYCSFVSFSNWEKIASYLSSLKAEISHYYKGESLNTLYFGGGTPSVLTTSQIKELISLFNISSETEITMEINPDTVDKKYLQELKKIGVNRLSFGCQTFDDKILKLINRRHNSAQVFEVVKSAKECGFNNISLDFIYGLPNQTTESFVNDLKTAVNLDIEHISLYGLKIEDDCYFAKNQPENLADDDMQADMFLAAIDVLTKNGFNHYEISNFSKTGYNSKHNLTYWENKEYYGFGVSAHGYVDGIRYANKNTLNDYINSPLIKESEHTVTAKEKLEEEIFLGFRKIQPDKADCGINIQNINKKFNIDFEEKYKKVLDKYLPLNLIKKTDDSYILTPQGILVSNVILSDFLDF